MGPDALGCNVLACEQVKWKLARGSWRPKLLGYAEEQKQEDVVSASTDAFKHAGD